MKDEGKERENTQNERKEDRDKRKQSQNNPTDLKRKERKAQGNRAIFVIGLLVLVFTFLLFWVKQDKSKKGSPKKMSAEVIEKNFATPIEYSEAVGSHIRKLQREMDEYRVINQDLNKKLMNLEEKTEKQRTTQEEMVESQKQLSSRFSSQKGSSRADSSQAGSSQEVSLRNKENQREGTDPHLHSSASSLASSFYQSSSSQERDGEGSRFGYPDQVGQANQMELRRRASSSGGGILKKEFESHAFKESFHSDLNQNVHHKTSENYVPSNTFVKAVMLSGVDASASVTSQSEPRPVLFRIVDEGTLPNGKKSCLKGCFISGAAIGDISSGRGMMRIGRISCVLCELNPFYNKTHTNKTKKQVG